MADIANTSDTCADHGASQSERLNRELNQLLGELRVAVATATLFVGLWFVVGLTGKFGKSRSHTT